MSVELRVQELERMLSAQQREIDALRAWQNAMLSNGLDQVFSKDNFQPRPFLYETTQLTVTNSAAVTDLVAIPLASRQLGFNGGLRVTIAGTYTNNSGVGRFFRLRCVLGGTTIWNSSSGTTALASSADARAWRLTVELMANGSLTAQQLLGLAHISVSTSPTTGIGLLSNDAIATPITGSATEDLSARSTFYIQANATAADPGVSWTRTFAVAEFL